MAISVCIDFKDRYPMDNTSDDLREGVFTAALQNGSCVQIKVRISIEPHRSMSFLYNLAFGPPDRNGRIDDTVKLAFKDYSKVFSTILFHGFNYLDRYEGHYLGIDGSTNSRAHLYYSFIQKNYNYLERHFNFYGLKYYVRISRFGRQQYDDPFDFDDIQFYPESIKKGDSAPHLAMYNYFIFTKKRGSFIS